MILILQKSDSGLRANPKVEDKESEVVWDGWGYRHRRHQRNVMAELGLRMDFLSMSFSILHVGAATTCDQERKTSETDRPPTFSFISV